MNVVRNVPRNTGGLFVGSTMVKYFKCSFQCPAGTPGCLYVQVQAFVAESPASCFHHGRGRVCGQRLARAACVVRRDVHVL